MNRVYASRYAALGRRRDLFAGFLSTFDIGRNVCVLLPVLTLPITARPVAASTIAATREITQRNTPIEAWNITGQITANVAEALL
jgi:hypothetical protein